MGESPLPPREDGAPAILSSPGRRPRAGVGPRRAVGEPDAEEATAADDALDLDRAALVADDPVADREAQSGARAYRLRREEGLEDVRQVLGADPAAVVFDLHED